MADDRQIQEQESARLRGLEQIRTREQIAAEREAEGNQEPEVNRMGWGIFAIGLGLTLLQAVIVDASAVSVVLYILGWLAGVAISAILWLILRPYKKSMREANVIVNIALVADALPFLDIFPIDVIALIYAFAKSRSKIVQKVAKAL